MLAIARRAEIFSLTKSGRIDRKSTRLNSSHSPISYAVFCLKNKNECATAFPYMFPRDFGKILQYALTRTPDARYPCSDLPPVLPSLVRYFLACSPERTPHRA